MATIYDVAARAGVSPATVSRVLNGRSVSPDNERLVLEAARELNFTPNRVARTLRPQLAGYSVVLCNTDGKPEKERHFLDIALSENMAGVVLAAADATSDARPLL